MQRKAEKEIELRLGPSESAEPDAQDAGGKLHLASICICQTENSQDDTNKRNNKPSEKSVIRGSVLSPSRGRIVWPPPRFCLHQLPLHF